MFYCVVYHLLSSTFVIFSSIIFFFFNDTATTEIYTLSLHELFRSGQCLQRKPHQVRQVSMPNNSVPTRRPRRLGPAKCLYRPDRKSTRLNSSHVEISYAVFCLKKKKFLKYITKNISNTKILKQNN